MTIRIYSTQTNATEYCEWKTAHANGLPVKGRSVVIKGGAGIITKGLFVTPESVPTIVSEDQLEFLESLEAFRRHKEAGFIRVVRSSKEADASKVAADMEARDGSSPMMPHDFAPEDVPKVGDEKPTSALSTKPRFVPNRQQAFR